MVVHRRHRDHDAAGHRPLSLPRKKLHDSDDKGMDKRNKEQGKSERWDHFVTAFRYLISVRICSAMWSGFPDCDEVFNYWEISHYLMFGSGMQTWEYDPQHAIRSYAYIWLYTWPGTILKTIHPGISKITILYLTRIMLAIICTLCEVYLHHAIHVRFGSFAAKITLVIQVISTGMSAAAVAFLPSSFSMYALIVITASSLLNDVRTCIVANAINVLLGWPFASIAAVPFVICTAIRNRGQYLSMVKWTISSFLLIVIPLVAIDSFYYGKLVFAPGNIVMYNVFGSSGGPDLYGTEPASYYLMNLILNFNLILIPVICAIPVFVIAKLCNNDKVSLISIDHMTVMASVLLWMLVFVPQSHKEERFMFPVYPLICLCAGLVIEAVVQFFSSLSSKVSTLCLNLSMAMLLMSALISISRGFALYKGFSAPIDSFTKLDMIHEQMLKASSEQVNNMNVCVGKEWHRFPSSFFLPAGWKLRFLKSNFAGQLPGYFVEQWNGTRIVRDDMNDQNKEEISRYFDLSQCDFLVDSDYHKYEGHDVAYVRDARLQVMESFKFLDTERTPSFFRSFYIPIISDKKWVMIDYNLMKKSPISPFMPVLPLAYKPNKWGSLRPGSYFGMKSMTENSLVTGIMWFRNKVEPGNNLPIRHWCSQSDSLSRYSWLMHDFDSFGVQEIVDGDVILKTDFLITGENKWSARIEMSRSANNSSTSDSSDQLLSLVFYAATEKEDDKLFGKKLATNSDFLIGGRTSAAGSPDGFSITITVIDGQESVVLSAHVGSKSVPPLVNLKESLMQNLIITKRRGSPASERLIVLQEQSEIPEDSNFVARQTLFRDKVTLKIDFSPSGEQHIPALQQLAASEYMSQLRERIDKFLHEFEAVFKLKAKGYTDEDVIIAISIVSNMIGSIGYFSGSVKVASSDALAQGSKFLPYGPFNLLTGVPSRSFFPRGFLWDEGFHNLLISRLRPDISVQILRSWISLMNRDGWIPREVILGQEAEARVPAEFVVQKDVNANPPTLFLTIESMLDRGVLPVEELSELFPRLKQWYNWFNRTQVGEVTSTYRWRGRDASAVNELNPKTLTSGLDDYPRATDPTKDEHHVDLRCWMALASRVMARISRTIGQEGQDFAATAEILSDNKLLDRLHWSDDDKMYCDFGMHSRNVKLVKKVDKKTESYVIIRKTLEPAAFGCVPDFGYVSLFPLLMQLLDPANPHLPLVMDRIERELLTPYGLRSLSSNSLYYNKRNTEHDPPYWRSAVWVNMNFLAVKSLSFYSRTNGPYRDQAGQLYTKVRTALISNILKEYKRTGYLWEQYDDVTGIGKGSHPFTGWSALIVLLMSEEF